MDLQFKGRVRSHHARACFQFGSGQTSPIVSFAIWSGVRKEIRDHGPKINAEVEKKILSSSRSAAFRETPPQNSALRDLTRDGENPYFRPASKLLPNKKVKTGLGSRAREDKLG